MNFYDTKCKPLNSAIRQSLLSWRLSSSFLTQPPLYLYSLTSFILQLDKIHDHNLLTFAMQYHVAYLGLYILSPQKAVNPRNAPNATFENCKFMKWAIAIFLYLYLLKIISSPCTESIFRLLFTVVQSQKPNNIFRLVNLPHSFLPIMIKQIKNTPKLKENEYKSHQL
jgi:hypothetical protein